MQKPISADEVGRAAASPAATPIRITIVTLDSHMASTVERARAILRRELPGLSLSLHAVTEWAGDEDAMARAREDIAAADIVIANMVFLEDHIKMIQPWLEEARETNDVMVGTLSAAEIVKLSRLGEFNMANPTGGMLGLLKRLRGKKTKSGSAGAGQMKMLRQIPKLLRFIPGKAQDVRAYFLTMQYMLAGSDDNIANLVRFLISRYAKGPREVLRTIVKPADPAIYPDVGLYHPKLKGRVTDDLAAYERAAGRKGKAGTVGLLVMRSYVLADNTAHYEGVIDALQAKGLKVVTAFASGLDARPAIEKYFMRDGRAAVDSVISLTGFSLVGGPAYNDAVAAEELLGRLDVPYISAFASEFQSLQQWGGGEQGLTPIEATIMVSLPEIDGATGPILYGGRNDGSGPCAGCSRRCTFDNRINGRDMQCCPDRAEMLADRVAKIVALRRRARADRKIAAIIYNFPPNGGATGTAAYLSVFRSLHNTLKTLKAEGYSVEVPESADALRDMILGGNADSHGTPANVAARIDADTHVRREPFLAEIEAQWGPAPGRQQTDGRDIFVMGHHFGNVFVGVQPAFGYEGDPMRLLFEKGFAPTHAFAAFYRYLKDDFCADAVLHFGTHGALEFMPGKHAGLSGDCWSDRLIGDLPNLYLYAANNPSEGAIARRRSAATLISHLTPPVAHAGLYKGLADLKSTIDRWRGLEPQAVTERNELAIAIKAQATALDLVAEDAEWGEGGHAEIPSLIKDLAEFEETLIPHGLHVVGEPVSDDERRDLLEAVNVAMGENGVGDLGIDGALEAYQQHGGRASEAVQTLARLDHDLRSDHELPALVHALDGGYVHPVSGGDIVRSPAIVPTGRNVHGFDPFRLPSAYAVQDGRKQAELLVARFAADNGGDLPKSVAMVLWGTDNLKSEGAPIAQALALIGAVPRFDGFGRLAGADLMPLDELGRARIDVVMTLSGIFRDLMPLQTRLLADASLQAAMADEPLDLNPIRAHALAYAEQHGCDMETAALRVFSNAAGAYGSNVNMLIDSGAWDEEDEIADTYTRRKSFAYGKDGKPVQRAEMLGTILKDVDAAYQNIESVELGITSIDHYFDTLGGISRAIRKAGGGDAQVYVGDQTSGKGKVRTLDEQVSLETRTRTLNPKFYEALLDHGYEGVRQIESQVTNTLGWSATTGKVAPWVYKNIAETFVLDAEMRKRLADLNPKASAKLAGRLIEASERDYWQPDEETWQALCAASEELEDRVEGINTVGVAA
ncbi:MAG: magnesium chelatase subunit H [Roseitalea sp.]|nr:magnesium chelatase subunit H [Roseitalea sp.]MBO6952370.1 magnesium chelatase subunit H [Rhizobiaceae bacterium]MBO6591784.1 magnesium chelatase subunit H [Roseitalea sp.]MBO6598039.1 magnesium chelatase subunit H [Roseitalea sp.]MBO6610485.1 magnesium chelatase subunit H [Roseitalea sp.]